MPAADSTLTESRPAVADASNSLSADGADRESSSGPAGPRRRRRYLSEPAPWRRTHIVRALVPVVVGAVVSGVCWFQLAGEVTLEAQQGWLVGAFFGTAIAALGGVYVLLVGLREVRIGQRLLVADLAQVMDWPLSRTGRVLSAAEAAGGDGATENAQLTLVTGPGMTLVHRADCAIAKGKAMRELTAEEAAGESLGRCGMCLS